MARTPQWKIDEFLDKVFVSEINPTPVKVVNVDDPAFCIAEDPSGNRRNIPWQQMMSGFYSRVE